MKPYDTKYLIKCLITTVVMIALCRASKGAAIALVGPLIFMAFTKKNASQAMYWLMFIVISLSMNPFFMPKGMTYAMSQRGMLIGIGLIGAVQLMAQRKNRAMGALMGMMVYAVYMIIPSIDGWWPMISFMKLFLFSSVFLSLVAITNSCLTSRRLNSRQIRSVFLSFAIVMIGGSFALIPFPGISQMSAAELVGNPNVASLFKGMTNHSQCLGPFMCVFGALLIADLLFGVRKMDKLYVLLILCVPVLIFKTSSRTAMGAFILVAVVIIYQFLRARNVNRRWRSKITSLIFLVVGLGLAGVVVVPSARDGIARYALKYDRSAKMKDVNVGQVMVTRQGLMDVQMRDFKRKPIFGNGFQVDEKLVNTMGGRKGMILSAPVEKGVWVTAILQEAGVVGMAIYLIFMIYVITTFSKMRYYTGLIMFIAVHLLNLGEFTLFSLSGDGGFLWAAVFIGCIMDEMRQREVQWVRFR